MLGEPDDLSQVSVSVFTQGDEVSDAPLYLRALLVLAVPEWDEEHAFDWLSRSIRKFVETFKDSTIIMGDKQITFGGSEIAGVVWLEVETVQHDLAETQAFNSLTISRSESPPPTATPATIPSPTATLIPTAIPSPTTTPKPEPPTATPTPQPTPVPKQGLGLHASEIQSAFEKPEWAGFEFTSSTMSNGIPLIKGHTDYQGAILRLYGPPDDLTLVHFSFAVSNGFPVSNVQSFLRAILAWSVQAWDGQSLDDWLDQAVQKYDQTGEGTTTVQYGRQIKLSGEGGEAWLRVEIAPSVQTWRGLVVEPEKRCSPYNSDHYRYSPSVKFEIVKSMGEGRIYGPYTGRYFNSVEQTDIEHIVARSEAHDSGLCAAEVKERKRFASDLLNLTLAAPDMNQNHKRAKDAAEWIPQQNQCWFADRVVKVRQKYSLTIDRQEADALDAVLSECASVEMVFTEETPVPAVRPTR